MRTTLTIDDDVAALLDQEVQRTGQPLDETVNHLLRTRLQTTSTPSEPKPFVMQTRHLGLPPKWTSGCVAELIEMLEGPLHR